MRGKTELPNIYCGANSESITVESSNASPGKTPFSNRQFIVRKADSKLPEYEPLTDRHLQAFIEKSSVKRQLEKLGLAKREASSLEIRPAKEKFSRIEMDLKESYSRSKK